MNISTVSLTLLAVCALVLAPSVASAQSVFNQADGDWNTAGHWTPPGRPGSGDDVVIPSGKICRVTTANQAANDVDVQGTLIIESKNLTISASETMTVDGTLQINKTDSDPAQLLAGGHLTIDGDGTVVGDEGVITNLFGGIGDLIIGVSGGGGDQVTVKGSITIDPAGFLENYGTLLVDAATDEMVLGKVAAGTERRLTGDGTIKVTVGTIKFARMFLSNPFHFELRGWTGTVTVDGSSALLHMTDLVYQQLGRGRVELKGGGKIDLESHWTSAGGFEFTDGEFKIDAGKTATFTKQY